MALKQLKNTPVNWAPNKTSSRLEAQNRSGGLAMVRLLGDNVSEIVLVSRKIEPSVDPVRALHTKRRRSSYLEGGSGWVN